MPNSYSRLADLKAELQGSGSGTSNDTVMLRTLERVSRGFDEQLGRHFYSRIATVLLPERLDRDVYGLELLLPEDLISVTTLKVDVDGDGVYETTLTVTTDYLLYPYNRLTYEPVRRIDLAVGASVSWPTVVRGVQIVGMFGYSHETQSAGTLAEEVDTTETAIDLTAGHDISPGDTLVCELEQMEVLTLSTNAITVTRAINGTTAVVHPTSTAISRRRFPRDIEAATVMQAARFVREIQTGYGGSIGNADLAGYAFSSMYPAIRDLIAPYKRNRSRAV